MWFLLFSCSPYYPLIASHALSSLAFISGLVEFPGRLWNPVRVSIPHPQHLTTTLIVFTELSVLLFFSFFFPDCNASVHKGCRDSLPVCAKVKMKVKVPAELLHHCLCSPEANIDLNCSFMLMFVFLLIVAETAVCCTRLKCHACSHNEKQMWVSNLTSKLHSWTSQPAVTFRWTYSWSCLSVMTIYDDVSIDLAIICTKLTPNPMC